MCHCRTYAEVCDGIYKKDVDMGDGYGLVHGQGSRGGYPEIVGTSTCKMLSC